MKLLLLASALLSQANMSEIVFSPEAGAELGAYFVCLATSDFDHREEQSWTADQSFNECATEEEKLDIALPALFDVRPEIWPAGTAREEASAIVLNTMKVRFKELKAQEAESNDRT